MQTIQKVRMIRNRDSFLNFKTGISNLQSRRAPEHEALILEADEGLARIEDKGLG